MLLVALLCPSAAYPQDDQLEYAVKATYLYKLPEFVSWPAGAIPATAFVLCIVGQSPFGSLLEQAVQDQKIEGRPFIIRRYRRINANPGCQLMYITGSADQPVADVLAGMRGSPVLTVTDGQTDPNARGIINFVVIDGHVRFEINRAMATASGLTISSKLLSLAVRTPD